MTDSTQALKRKVSGKVVYENDWIKVHEDQTVTSDGQEGVYGYMESRDSVAVIVARDDSIYMVRNYRYPTQTWGWELPGGGGEGEEPLQAAKREMEEETGILADSWEVLGKTLVCNGLMTESMTTCLARDLYFDGDREVSDEVFEGMQFFTPDEIDTMIDDGDINDCQTIASVHLYRRHLAKEAVNV